MPAGGEQGVAAARVVTAGASREREHAPGPVPMALLFTDVVDSTGLLKRVGEEAAEALWREHLAAMRAAADAFGGEEVKTLGDGLMLAFAGATDAIGCAARIQAEVRDRAPEAGGEPLRVRIGLNTASRIPAWRSSTTTCKPRVTSSWARG